MSGQENHRTNIDSKKLMIASLLIDEILSPDELLRRFKEAYPDDIIAYPSGLTLRELENRRHDRFSDWIG